MRGGVAAGTACCAPTELIWAAQVVWERAKFSAFIQRDMTSGLSLWVQKVKGAGGDALRLRSGQAGATKSEARSCER
jgi:hypothetical protein